MTTQQKLTPFRVDKELKNRELLAYYEYKLNNSEYPHLEVKISHRQRTLSYFTSEALEGGFYMQIKPCYRGDLKSMTFMGDGVDAGVNMLIVESSRFNAKKLASLECMLSLEHEKTAALLNKLLLLDAK